jgi:hypothetical protein
LNVSIWLKSRHPMNDDGLSQARDILDGAEEIPPPPGADDMPPDGQAGDRPEGWRPAWLPKGCPVVPLGVRGDICYYLDALCQLREVKDKDHARLRVQNLFGHLSDMLEEYWPRKTKIDNDWVVTGWKPEAAAQALMGAAAECGVWSPFGRVRGAGAWLGADGELILHLGDRLLILEPGHKARKANPGVVSDQVYPAAPRTQRPADKPQLGGERGPAAELLSILKTWNFRRGEVDAVLLLGWIGAGMLGGALKWRPVLWTTGGKHTGKSTLQDLLEWIMGPNGLLHTGDASEAGIRQTLGHSALPVAIDEAESEEDNRRLNALVKLARNAASGSLGVRGGSDHNAASFVLRSCVMFSSILLPPLLGQDRSRMAILELGKLGSTKPPVISQARMDKMGQALRRRLVDGWDRWPQTLEAYRQGLADVGHVGRGCDVFGTLLACADLLMHDGLPDEQVVKGWASKLAAETLSELEGDISDEAHCLNHLLTTSVELKGRGDRRTLGSWIQDAAKSLDRDRYTAEALMTADATAKALTAHGVKLIRQNMRPYLAVANYHQGLAAIFRDTHWGTRSGTLGVWVQALRRLPDAVVPGATLWIGGAVKGTLVPLGLCLPGGRAHASESEPLETPAAGVARPPLAGGAGQTTLPYDNSPPQDDFALDDPY